MVVVIVVVEGGIIWSASVEVTLPRGVAVTPPIWIEPEGFGAMVLGAILEGAVIFLPEGMLLGEKSCLRAPDPGERMWSLGPVERGESGGGEGGWEGGVEVSGEWGEGIVKYAFNIAIPFLRYIP